MAPQPLSCPCRDVTGEASRSVVDNDERRRRSVTRKSLLPEPVVAGGDPPKRVATRKTTLDASSVPCSGQTGHPLCPAVVVLPQRPGTPAEATALRDRVGSPEGAQQPGAEASGRDQLGVRGAADGCAEPVRATRRAQGQDPWSRDALGEGALRAEREPRAGV